MTSSKRIGILGSGDVAKALGKGFAAHGWNAKLGSRDPKKLAAWRQEAGPSATAGTFAEAAQHGDVVVLAVMGAAADSALDLAGPAAFDGKLVLDATNPLDFSMGMPPGLLFGTTDSLGERIQRKLPKAKVVKCFNTVSNAKMVDPRFEQGEPPMLICGNDAEAKKRTDAILKELGWPGALDMGDIAGARWLEAMVPLWVRAGAALNTWGHIFTPVR